MKNTVKMFTALLLFFAGFLLGAALFHAQTAKAAGGSVYITKTTNPRGDISVLGENVVGFSCLQKEDQKVSSNVTIESEVVCYIASQ